MLQKILDFCRFFHLVIKNLFFYQDSRMNSLDKVYTSFCRTLLHIAVMYDDIQFAQNILNLKPDLAMRKDTNGFTPLHIASARTSVPMVKLLLKAEPKACIVRDEDGKTPLHLAAMKNRVEIMKVLMKQGLPEVIQMKNDQNGETILHFCVRSNSDIKTLALLINELVLQQPPDPNSISVNSRDNDGNTVLHLAANMGSMEVNADYSLLISII
ncbi:hypothetical protein MKX03_021344 [Papaver bracteatum]|nr:hypothetical protein MKX03_021344 [Papaver bracteatum]